MATKTYVDFDGLQYYDQKLKASLAHPTHSYTVAQNAAKNWYRIANAAGSQIDTSKPLHVQFLVTAWNSGADTGYYQQWFVDSQVFGRNAGIRIFGNSSAPFSQIRVLYENTIADIDANDRPAIDLYLNYVLANAATNVKVEEIYNSGWTFVADGALAASTVPTGFENVAASPLNSGIGRASNSTYTDYAALQRSNITANCTLADSTTYRGRVLNCTNAITVTVPSINSVWSWFIIKNFNANGSGKNVTIHPSTTSVLIDDSNADIVLAPGEYVLLHSKAANSYTLLMDGRWKSADANAVHKTGDETIAGVKTFTGQITSTTSYFRSIGNIDKTATGTGEQEAVIFNTADKNNVAICQLNAERNLAGAFQELRFRNWNINNLWSDFRLRCTDDNKYWLTMAAKDGMSFGLAPTDSSLAIPTTAWIRSATGNFALNAATATKATQDGSGNVITATYATKAELPADYVGATSSANGVHGLVPAAAIAEKDCFLCGDGTWDAISGMTNAQIDTAMANVGYVGDIDPSLLTSITNAEIDALFA